MGDENRRQKLTKLMARRESEARANARISPEIAASMQSAREMERRFKQLMLPLRRAIAESKALSTQIKVKRDKLRVMMAQLRLESGSGEEHSDSRTGGVAVTHGPCEEAEGSWGCPCQPSPVAFTWLGAAGLGYAAARSR